jgi:hypothetical protein
VAEDQIRKLSVPSKNANVPKMEKLHLAPLTSSALAVDITKQNRADTEMQQIPRKFWKAIRQ